MYRTTLGPNGLDPFLQIHPYNGGNDGVSKLKNAIAKQMGGVSMH